MKPTFQISLSTRNTKSRPSQNQKLSRSAKTDWSFQTAAPDLRGASVRRETPVAPGFRALTQGLFEADQRNYRLEGGAFVVIIGLAVWPMVIAAQAAFALLK